MSKIINVEAENNKYEISIPTYSELTNWGKKKKIENIEGQYYHWLSIFTMTPSSVMVNLDDIGIDYETISDYELFCLMYNSRNSQIDDFMSFVIKVNGVEFSDYIVSQNNETKETVLHNSDTGKIFSKNDYDKLVEAITDEFNLTRENSITANEATKKYLIEMRRRKEKIQAKRKTNFPNIIGRVNKMQNELNRIKDLPISDVFTANAKLTAFEKIYNELIGL